MTHRTRFFTSESVTEGHPDKLADQISDAVLDAVLSQDPYGRVACETLLKGNRVIVAGEISATARIDHEAVVRRTLLRVGYDDAEAGIDGRNCAITSLLDGQSPEIEEMVKPGGAGDQGLMFGYACRETDTLMPLPIHLAHRLAERLAEVRRQGPLLYLRPDGKTQVTVEYLARKPRRVSTLVLSAQHEPGICRSRLEDEIKTHVVRPIIPPELLTRDTDYRINRRGPFTQGGPSADCRLTGRKIIVDTYGGYARHGGGAFSGKDPSKVDRSAAYMARHIAKTIVSADLAGRAEVQLAFVIGDTQPVSVRLDTFGTAKTDSVRLEKLIPEFWNLSPAGIISYLDLRRPIFETTAAYGHFGRENPEFTWENTDRAQELRNRL